MQGLLFYDSAGTGAFYTTDGQGGIHLLRTNTGWQSAGKPWTHIIPGNFGGSSFTDLLFYDSAGTGAFYTTDGQGGIHLLRTHTGWQSAGNPWTQIIAGNFGGRPPLDSTFTDLLFYDAAAGIGNFYKTDGQGGITLLRQLTGLGSWKIVPSEFSGYLTDLVFYSGATGRFYETNWLGQIGQLTQYDDWRTSWTHIIPGDFGGSNFTNLRPPSNLRVTDIAEHRIDVSWIDNPVHVDGFRIRFRGTREGQGDHTGSVSVGPNSTNASLTNLFSGYEYTISVVAFNIAGESGTSNEVRATTLAEPQQVFIVAGIEYFEPGSLLRLLRIRGNGFQAAEMVKLQITSRIENDNPFTETRTTTADPAGNIDFKYSGGGGGVCPGGIEHITFWVQATGLTSLRKSNVAEAGC